MSRVGCRPASRRNLSASPCALTLSVCSNSVEESGLDRISASLTTPTVTASLGMSDSASVFAKTGTARRRAAQIRNSFFISELLSLEQKAGSSKTDYAESGGGDERHRAERSGQSLRHLIARDIRHHGLAELRGLRYDPVQRVDHRRLPLLGKRGGDPLVADEHEAEEKQAVCSHDRNRSRRRHHADGE